MTDILRDARSKMQSKAERFLAGDKPGKVDCSDYTPEALDVESNEKNSGQPNNPRMRYKRGGTVVSAEGDKPKVNAGRKPRSKNASGGALDPKMNDLPAPRDSGGAKNFGESIDRAVGMIQERNAGGLHDLARKMPAGREKDRYNRAGDGMKKDFNERIRPKMDKFGAGPGYAKGGRTERASGDAAKSLGPVNGPIKSIYGNSNVSRELNKPLGEKQVMADNLRRSREASRTQRASGGRTKGKTNINIIIGAGGGHPQPGGQPPMMPPIGAAPVAPPPEGALPPQGAPAPAAPPPMGMPRKDGGRTIKMEYGAGGGKGRLEKAGKY